MMKIEHVKRWRFDAGVAGGGASLYVRLLDRAVIVMGQVCPGTIIVDANPESLERRRRGPFKKVSGIIVYVRGDSVGILWSG